MITNKTEIPRPEDSGLGIPNEVRNLYQFITVDC